MCLLTFTLLDNQLQVFFFLKTKHSFPVFREASKQSLRENCQNVLQPAPIHRQMHACPKQLSTIQHTQYTHRTLAPNQFTSGQSETTPSPPAPTHRHWGSKQRAPNTTKVQKNNKDRQQQTAFARVITKYNNNSAQFDSNNLQIYHTLTKWDRLSHRAHRDLFSAPQKLCF
jgi:hypothetical protein